VTLSNLGSISSTLLNFHHHWS